MAKRSALQIYALIVCFFAVAYAAVVGAGAVWSGVSLAAPAFTLDRYEWSRHQSDEAFCESRPPLCTPMEDKGAPPPLPPEARAAERARSYALALAAHRREAGQDLLRALIGLFFAGLILALHWRLARRATDPDPA